MRSSLGSIEDLGDGRFRVRVPGGYDRDGKRVRPSRVIRGTRRDAERERAFLLMQHGRGSAGSLTVTSFLEDVWLPTKDRRRRRTVSGYRSKINSCIAPYIGHLNLDDVTPYVVERWLSDLQREPNKSAQTVKHARAVLKNAMRAAVRWGLIDRDPTEGSEIPEVDYQPTVLDAEQMNAYLDAFAGHPVEPAVIISIALGTRRSETCALDWSDIDFDAATVDIARGVHQENSEVWFEDTKTRTSKRLLALPEWAVEALKPLRGTGPLVADGGKRMAPEKVSRLYKQHIIDSKLAFVPLRDLRNSLGTFLYESGVELGRIADQLGHSGTEVTRKHYVVRSHKKANHSTAAVVQSLRVGQNVPNSKDVQGRNPRKSRGRSTDSMQEAQ